MRTSLFLDLDGLLIRSYSKDDIDRFGTGDDLPFLQDAKGIFGGILVKKRPHVEQFLETACACGDVFLFTAAKLGYAKSALKAFQLESYFTKFYTGQLSATNTIAYDLNLYGRPWVLVDDSPRTHDTVLHKLGSLGLKADVEEAILDRHFFQVSSYQPHRLGEENANDLLTAAENLRDRVKTMEKRMILY